MTEDYYEKYSLDVNADEPDIESYIQPQKPSSVRSKSLPREFEVSHVTPIENQGSLGSCVGFAIKESLSHLFPSLNLSALWIYKRAQKHDSFKGEDYSGTTVLGGCLACIKDGVVLEKHFPYDTKALSPKAWLDASSRKLKWVESFRSSSVEEMQKALIENDQSLKFSFHVHKAFYSAYKDGFIVDEDSYLKSEKRGGHAASKRGWKYINGKPYWKCQNSWGKGFGDAGYFYISFELMKKISKGAYLLHNSGDPKGKASYFFLSFFNHILFVFNLAYSAISNLLSRFTNKGK